MYPKPRLLEAAATLRPLPVRNYVECRRWTPVEGTRRRLWVFSHPEQQFRQVQIPIDPEVPGFADAMLEVARRLAEVENRDLLEILSDLQHPDADTLRFRVSGAAAQGGQLLLTDDLNLREGARRALLAAASSVINPVMHHPRLSRSQADQFVRACLAGQTEQGSYVVKIVCPLNAMSECPTLDDTTPFARQATSLLMEATSELVESIERDRLEAYLDRDRKQPKVSWNLCDALLRMRPGHGGAVELSVNWAADSKLGAPEVRSKVALPEDDFPGLERAARIMRPVAAPDRAQLLIGTVESLEGVVGEDGRRGGDVVLSVLADDGDALRARVSLSPEQYAIADRAHMQGLGYIWVRGILRMGVRLGRIEHVTRFDLIEQKNSDGPVAAEVHNQQPIAE